MYYIIVSWELVWRVYVCDVIVCKREIIDGGWTILYMENGGSGWGIASGEKQSGNEHCIYVIR